MLSGRADFQNGELVELDATGLDTTALYLEHEAEQELENVAGNVNVALQVLKDVPDEQVADDDVSADFFARWRREAKVIGDSDLQEVWGRLLAEEIKKPESVSYRTIDVIKI